MERIIALHNMARQNWPIAEYAELYTGRHVMLTGISNINLSRVFYILVLYSTKLKTFPRPYDSKTPIVRANDKN